MTKTLVHLFQASANNAPDAEAVIHKDRRVTYGQLFANVKSIAAFLREKGLEKGARVGILMENCPEYIAAYYGILAAGGAVVGLNSAAKARNCVTCLKHCSASWLIADGGHRELPDLMEQIGERLELVVSGNAPEDVQKRADTSLEEIFSKESKELDLSLLDDPQQLGAMIYTSGTTGDPKGVMLSHGNLMANTESIIEYLGLTSSDSIVNVLPFHYSYGNSVLHTHMATGGRLVLENSMIYPQKVLERMAQEKVTGFSGVPSTFALLLSRTKLTNFDLSSIRYMTQAGGPMPPANVDRFTKELPHVRFFVMYGQTEGTARLAYLPPDKLVEKLGSCGIPIPGVKLEIRDSDGKVAPPHETGEIYVTGKNIMLGYWNNPEGTKKVIIDGWLKTGDLAHMDEDGYVFIDGRASDMIKSGAHRISPQEIEEIIAELDEVAEVAVCGAPDEVLGQVIKAVIILKEDARLDAKAVQKHCMENLAQYKLPKEVVFTDNLPRTASGKVRRHLLV